MNNNTLNIPDSIKGDTAIQHYFHADDQFNAILASSPEAQLAHKIAQTCTARVAELSQAIGLSAPKGLSILSLAQKIHVFPVTPDEQVEGDAQHLGFTTATHVRSRDLLSHIKQFQDQ